MSIETGHRPYSGTENNLTNTISISIAEHCRKVQIKPFTCVGLISDDIAFIIFQRKADGPHQCPVGPVRDEKGDLDIFHERIRSRDLYHSRLFISLFETDIQIRIREYLYDSIFAAVT